MGGGDGRLVINLTAEELSSLAEQGRYWWARGSGTCYGTTEKIPADETDTYLLDASPNWIAQWGDDWAAAFNALKPALDKLNEEG